MTKEDRNLPASFGDRFLSELRRLTDSTWGFTYKQVSEIGLADQATLLRLLQERAPELLERALDRISDLEPETLARALVEEARRGPARWDGPNPFDVLLDALLQLHS